MSSRFDRASDSAVGFASDSAVESNQAGVVLGGGRPIAGADHRVRVPARARERARRAPSRHDARHCRLQQRWTRCQRCDQRQVAWPSPPHR
eukprot:2793758-Rhodomonas_salina.2